MTDKPLVNRVAKSGLITINLEEYYPQAPIVELDIKQFLFKELILKEKDFRAAIKEIDWTQYEGQILAVYCSTDAIIPVWAFQLLTVMAAPYAERVIFGDKERALQQFYYQRLNELDVEQYQDERIIIKGCSNKPVPVVAYMELARRLQPYAKTIMYGEPCSTVPLYKKKRK